MSLLLCYMHTIDEWKTVEFIITENLGPIIVGKCTNEAVEIITVNAVGEMTVCSEPKNTERCIT